MKGSGNQFLANIRECDAIVHMVRCFENDDVIHVDASIDPVRDVEVIELELALLTCNKWRNAWNGPVSIKRRARPRRRRDGRAHLEAPGGLGRGQTS